MGRRARYALLMLFVVACSVAYLILVFALCAGIVLTIELRGQPTACASPHQGDEINRAGHVRR